MGSGCFYSNYRTYKNDKSISSSPSDPLRTDLTALRPEGVFLLLPTQHQTADTSQASISKNIFLLQD